MTLTAGLLIPRAAHAGNMVELYLQGQGGYGGGSGSEETVTVAGQPVQRADFYKLVHGPALGAEVGIKLLMLDVYLDYLQFLGDHDGKMLKVILGLRMDFGEQVNVYFRFGVGPMFGYLGDDSLNGGKDPVGFTVRGGIGLLYKIIPIFSVGPVADLGWYYLFNGTVESQPNVPVGYSNSQGIDYMILFAARLTFGI